MMRWCEIKNATAKEDFAYASNNPIDGDATLVHQLPQKEIPLHMLLRGFKNR